MPIITHSDTESPMFKLGKSICGKILQKMPTPGALTIFPVGPANSYTNPDPPYSGNLNPNQTYSGMINPIIAAFAQKSALFLDSINIVDGEWNYSGASGSNSDYMECQWNGTELVNFEYQEAGLSVGSYWSVAATQFPDVFPSQWENPPYTYATGSALATTEAAAYGCFGAPTLVALHVGSSRYTINTYCGTIAGSYIYPQGTVVPPTIGTNALTYTDSAGNDWTISNGNGYILIPVPVFNPNFVKIGNVENSGKFCASLINNVNGLTNILTVLPPI